MTYPAAAILGIACALCAIPALGQTVPSPSPSPSASASAGPAPQVSATPSPAPTHAWQTGGYVATQYNWFQGGDPVFTDGTPARVFDTQPNQPTLNAVNVQLTKVGTIGGKLELTAGTNADVIASYPDQVGDAFDVTQAYLAYSGGPFTVIAGKFETLAGAEVIEDPSDANISRSILFGYAVPFTHTGARVTYAPSGTFAVIAGINNGWDNLKGNGTGAHTGEFGLAYTGPVVSLTAQTYQGTERISNTDWALGLGHRSLIDLVGTYHVTSAVTLQANYDHGSQANAPLDNGTIGTATWQGLAGYANWQMTPKWAGSLRIEGFEDLGGYRTGFTQHWTEQTVTLGYNLTSQLTLRGEVRYDASDRGFISPSGPVGTLASYELQALVHY